MNPPTPRLDLQTTPLGVVAALQGQWTVAQLSRAAVWAPMAGTLKATVAQQPAGWDLTGLDQLDHLGAQCLWHHWGGQWPAQLATTPSQRAVLERVAASGETDQATPPSPAAYNSLVANALTRLGNGVATAKGHASGMLQLVGQLVLDFGRLLRRPHDAPWRDVSGHLYRIGASALPITALLGALIGVVLAYLISQQLRQFGAGSFIVNILGISLVRELGPVLAAILIAGRSGSAITAQIGVMRVTEELDAMRVMGIAPGYRLVLPRALALAIAMPLISVWTTLAALLGGMVATQLATGIAPSFFIRALPEAVDVANLVLATSKSVVFGLVIALVGCHFGLRVKPNTQSLGQGTTASVVASITLVIMVNALFAVLFKSVGI